MISIVVPRNEPCLPEDGARRVCYGRDYWCYLEGEPVISGVSASAFYQARKTVELGVRR